MRATRNLPVVDIKNRFGPTAIYLNSKYKNEMVGGDTELTTFEEWAMFFSKYVIDIAEYNTNISSRAEGSRVDICTVQVQYLAYPMLQKDFLYR